MTVRRVLPSEGAGPMIETSFQVEGSILGVARRTTGTYPSVMRPDTVAQLPDGRRFARSHWVPHPRAGCLPPDSGTAASKRCRELSTVQVT